MQWRGTRPVFIDVGSFERLRPDEPWAGYRQFCMLFLYPLMLQAYKDLPFHALLRGSLDGIPPQTARAVLSSGRDRFRRGDNQLRRCGHGHCGRRFSSWRLCRIEVDQSLIG